MGPHFNEQLPKAPENCHPILDGLHHMLFKREEDVAIDEMIDFLFEKSKEL